MQPHSRAFLAWGICVALCGAQMLQAQPQVQSAEADSAVAETGSPEFLLRSSDRMGSLFSPDDRSFQLVRLAEVGSELPSESCRRLVAGWATTLFRTARQRPKDWNRGAFEKNAAELLSTVDPNQALKFLRQVDPPDLDSHPAPPEDLRAFGARTVFPAYWSARGVAGLTTLREVAIEFGRNGEYPYPAVASLLNSLGESDSERAFKEELFNDAIRFYEQPTVIRSADQDFVEFIDKEWGRLDKIARLSVLRAAVGRLTSEEVPDPTSKFAARVSTAKASATFDSRKLLLLFQLLPKIKDVDGDWGAKLEKEYADLRQDLGSSTEKALVSSYIVEDPSGDATQRSIASTMNQGLESGVLQKIRETSKVDVVAAIRMLPQVTNPEYRAEGMAYVAAGLVQTDPVGAESLLKTALITATGIPGDLVAKARACAVIADAAAAMKNLDILHAALNGGFLAAREAISEDIDLHPTQPYYFAKGMDEASRLIRLQARTEPEEARYKVEGLQAGELKAFLLIDLAAGLAH